MGLMDKLTAGIERFAEEADKAIDKGKTKVGEMQIELQMDGLAKKLGYLVFDFYRGREVDQAQRQNLLDELSRLEDKLFQTRAEAAAKAEAEAAQRAQKDSPAAQAGRPAWTSSPVSGDTGAQTTAGGAEAPPAEASPAEASPSGSAPPGV